MAVKPIQITTSGNQNAQLRALDRQRQLALQLQNQALQPMSGGRMVGRTFVPDHPMQGISKLGQMLAGKYREHQADKEQKAYDAKQRLNTVNALSGYHKDSANIPAVAGRPEVHATPEQGNPYDIWTGGTTHVPATPYQPAIAGTPAIPRTKEEKIAAIYKHLLPADSQLANQFGVKELERLYEEKEKKLHNVPKNTDVIDPETRKLIYSNKTEESGLDSTHRNKATILGYDQNTKDPKQLQHIASEVLKDKQSTAARVNVVNEAQKVQTKSQQAINSKYVDTYNEWRDGDKASQVISNLKQLDHAYNTLEQFPEIVGAFKGSMPDIVIDWTNPKLASVKESVAAVVQQNLKAILGGQFTEKEGENLIRRAFNPRLGAKENLRRVGLLRRQMMLAMQAKEARAKYFEDNGYNLVAKDGNVYRGKRIGLSDFDHLEVFGGLTDKDKGFIPVDLDEDGNLIEGREFKGLGRTQKVIPEYVRDSKGNIVRKQ